MEDGFNDVGRELDEGRLKKLKDLEVTYLAQHDRIQYLWPATLAGFEKTLATKTKTSPSFQNAKATVWAITMKFQQKIATLRQENFENLAQLFSTSESEVCEKQRTVVAAVLERINILLESEAVAFTFCTRGFLKDVKEQWEGSKEE